MQLVLTDSQKVELVVTARNRRGNPAPLQSPTWKSSDDAILTVTVDPADPLKATASAVAAGTALVTFDADADMGEGVEDIIGTLDVVVTEGKATVIEIAPGPVVEQTP